MFLGKRNSQFSEFLVVLFAFLATIFTVFGVYAETNFVSFSVALVVSFAVVLSPICGRPKSLFSVFPVISFSAFFVFFRIYRACIN
jgi:hypothetical protein